MRQSNIGVGEVLTLAELFIEEIVVDSTDITEGDVVSVKIYVRNSGNSEATFNLNKMPIRLNIGWCNVYSNVVFNQVNLE